MRMIDRVSIDRGWHLATTNAVMEAATEVLARRPIQAIKALRSVPDYKLGLKEAKDIIDRVPPAAVTGSFSDHLDWAIYTIATELDNHQQGVIGEDWHITMPTSVNASPPSAEAQVLRALFDMQTALRTMVAAACAQRDLIKEQNELMRDLIEVLS